MEVDNRLHRIAAKALAGLPRRPYDDTLDADGTNRLRSRIIDDAVRIAKLEAALRQITSPAAWGKFEPDTPIADSLYRQTCEMQRIAADALQVR